MNLLLLNDPASECFGTDVDDEGKATYFGAVHRNRAEEERAMRAGLAPAQIRASLNASQLVFQQLDAFLMFLAHHAISLEPLTYASAWVFERRGFAYMRGHKLMDDIHREFQPGGKLHSALDGSTPFRQPDQSRTVRGRAWAIQDGILQVIDAKWDGLRMVKQIGRHAGENPALPRLLARREFAALLQAIGASAPKVALALVRADGNVFVSTDNARDRASFGNLSGLVHLADRGKVIHRDGQRVYPLFASENLVGALVASGDSPNQDYPLERALRQSIALMLTQSVERREIANEALERYREINLMYRVSETIGAAFDSRGCRRKGKGWAAFCSRAIAISRFSPRATKNY